MLDDEEMKSLKDSIMKDGLLNPIVISLNYHIVAGFRRAHCYKVLGYKNIPCRILNSDDQNERYRYNLVENIIRKDLTPIEEANAYRHFLDNKLAKSETDLALLLHIPIWRISLKLKLLNLSKSEQKQIGKGISESAALKSLDLTSVKERIELIKKGATVREVKEKVAKKVAKKHRLSISLPKKDLPKGVDLEVFEKHLKVCFEVSDLDNISSVCKDMNNDRLNKLISITRKDLL